VLYEIIWNFIFFDFTWILGSFLFPGDAFFSKSYEGLQERTISVLDHFSHIESCISSLLQFLLDIIRFCMRHHTDGASEGAEREHPIFFHNYGNLLVLIRLFFEVNIAVEPFDHVSLDKKNEYTIVSFI